MQRERGFSGVLRTLRQYVAQVRPKPRCEIYLSTETIAAEQAQVDWPYLDEVPVPGGVRALWLFVMVLAHSRALAAELDVKSHHEPSAWPPYSTQLSSWASPMRSPSGPRM